MLHLSWVHADDSKADYWTRLNYGIAAVKVKPICIADGYITHMIHFGLPILDKSEGNPLINASCDASCSRVSNLIKATNALSISMKKSITDMVTKIFTLIPDISIPSRGIGNRYSRAPFDFIGDASSFLFGTATLADVETLRKEILAIKSLATAAASDASYTQQGSVSFRHSLGGALPPRAISLAPPGKMAVAKCYTA